MQTEPVRTLADAQLQTFADNDYVTDKLFDGMSFALERDFGERFSFLDVGGGCGYFADRLLARFPKSNGTILDNSKLLLSQNAANPRKTLVLASATEMAGHFNDRRFDVVFFNLALHHFIGASYGKTRVLQRKAIAQARAVLAPGGRIVVTENLFDGMFADNFPGALIYALTSSPVLAPLVRRLGANTAGVGVCFLSTRGWRKEFSRLNLDVSMFVGEVWRECVPWREIRLRMLGVKRVTRAFFWLAPKPDRVKNAGAGE